MGRRLEALLLALLIVACSVTPTAWALEAGCRPDQKLEIIGSVRTTSGVIGSGGHEVRLIVTACGTACSAGLYDTDSLYTASATTLRLEPNAPANSSQMLPQTGFLAQPLTFSTGITFVDDGNVNAIALYECVQR